MTRPNIGKQMSDKSKGSKDGWDKGEIFGKIVGSILIPIVVGGMAFTWNQGSSKRQISAQMMQIAVGILQSEIKPDGSDEPLRNWAISILKDPLSPPIISDEAADSLRKGQLSVVMDGSSVFTEELKRLLDVSGGDIQEAARLYNSGTLFDNSH